MAQQWRIACHLTPRGVQTRPSRLNTRRRGLLAEARQQVSANLMEPLKLEIMQGKALTGPNSLLKSGLTGSIWLKLGTKIELNVF